MEKIAGQEGAEGDVRRCERTFLVNDRIFVRDWPVEKPPPFARFKAPADAQALLIGAHPEFFCSPPRPGVKG